MSRSATLMQQFLRTKRGQVTFMKEHIFLNITEEIARIVQERGMIFSSFAEAVEWDEELAKLYKERFPNDTVIVADAHQYLLDHYKEFDFIWSSPPCPSHSKIRHQKACYFNSDVYPVIYPDMSLYQEIILLSKYFKGGYVVENVSPYYTPLIEAKKRGRHLYWTNFNIPITLSQREQAKITSGGNEVKNLSKFHDYDFTKYKGTQRTDKIARNLVDYEAGRTILETWLGIERKKDVNQTTIFDI